MSENNNKQTTKTPLRVQLKEANEKAIRALAEMENMRRREAENRKNWSRLSVADFVRPLLARFGELQHLQSQTDDENATKTIENFFKSLHGAGLEPITPQKGEKVDPDQHEVLMTAEGEPGTIGQVLESGWQYQNQTIMPAKVSAVPEA